MATESVHSRAADAVFLPADGLRLLGQYQGGGRRFLVARGDGEVIQLALLPYLIMAAIAEGGVDGGWSADQVCAGVRSASGQGLTVDTVRYLIAGKLDPLGLVAADDADRPDEAPDGRRPRRRPLGRTTSAGPVGRVRPRPIADPVGRLLLPPPHRRRWAIALGGAAVLVCVAATAPIMAETGNGGKGRAGQALSSAAAPAAAPVSAVTESRLQAAAWVAQQVSPDVTVSCDPGTCRQLRLDGFPATRLTPLGGGVHALLGSGIVVATPAVRSQLGPRLAAAYAPQVIASFGSAPAGSTSARSRRPAPPPSRPRSRPSRTPSPRPAANCSATRTSRPPRRPGRRWRAAGSTPGCSRSCRCSPPSCRSGWWPSPGRRARAPACRCAAPRSASPRRPPGPRSSACSTRSRAPIVRPP